MEVPGELSIDMADTINTDQPDDGLSQSFSQGQESSEEP